MREPGFVWDVLCLSASFVVSCCFLFCVFFNLWFLMHYIRTLVSTKTHRCQFVRPFVNAVHNVARRVGWWGIVMDRICRTSDLEKFGACRTFQGNIEKDSAKVRQMSARAWERDGAMDCKWTPCGRGGYHRTVQFYQRLLREVRIRWHGNCALVSHCECRSLQ